MTAEARIGLFVTIAIIILLGAVVSLTNVEFWNGYRLRLVLSDANGISSDSLVKMRGVTIGKVKQLTLAPDSVCVQLLFKRQYPIPQDSTFRVAGTGVIAMKFVEVLPGVSTGTFHGGETVFGESSPDADVMLDEFSQVMSELTSTVRQIRRAIEPLSGETGKEIAEIISSIKQITTHAATLVGETESAVRRVSPEIESAVRELKTRLEELGELTDKETTAEIKQAVERLNKSLGYVEKFLGTRIK